MDNHWNHATKPTLPVRICSGGESGVDSRDPPTMGVVSSLRAPHEQPSSAAAPLAFARWKGSLCLCWQHQPQPDDAGCASAASSQLAYPHTPGRYAGVAHPSVVVAVVRIAAV